MILAFSLTLLLWQGTFAQPQLDGRYGVDRVAMEKQARIAANYDPCSSVVEQPQLSPEPQQRSETEGQAEGSIPSTGPKLKKTTVPKKTANN